MPLFNTIYFYLKKRVVLYPEYVKGHQIGGLLRTRLPLFIHRENFPLLLPK